jgi:hypothetical protein
MNPFIGSSVPLATHGERLVAVRKLGLIDIKWFEPIWVGLAFDFFRNFSPDKSFDFCAFLRSFDAINISEMNGRIICPDSLGSLNFGDLLGWHKLEVYFARQLEDSLLQFEPDSDIFFSNFNQQFNSMWVFVQRILGMFYVPDYLRVFYAEVSRLCSLLSVRINSFWDLFQCELSWGNRRWVRKISYFLKDFFYIADFVPGICRACSQWLVLFQALEVGITYFSDILLKFYRFIECCFRNMETRGFRYSFDTVASFISGIANSTFLSR